MQTGIPRPMSPRPEWRSAITTCIAVLAISGLTSCAILDPQPTAPPGDRYLVFFDTKSTELDANAVAVVDTIAAGAKASKPDLIVIRGYADMRGSAGYNAQLSNDRAQAVAHALLDRGIEARQLRTQAFGATSISGEAGAESADRRVEVLFQPNQ